MSACTNREPLDPASFSAPCPLPRSRNPLPPWILNTITRRSLGHLLLLTHLQVVALKDPAFVNPEAAIIHAPLALTPVPYPRARFELAQKARGTGGLIRGM